MAIAATAVLVSGAALPPFVSESVGAFLHQTFAPVCHQMPARSFAVGGVPFAVCHRCFGIYAGLLVGVLAWPLLAVRLREAIGLHAAPFVVAAGAPAGVDWALGLAGLWTNTAFSQTATGALLGVALGTVLAHASTSAAPKDRRGALQAESVSGGRPSGTDEV